MSYEKNVFYQNGLPYVCSDLTSDREYYAAGQAESFKILPDDAQTKYAQWVMYYIIVLLFIRIFYRLWYKIGDRQRRINGKLNGVSTLFSKPLALSRWIGYRRIPYIWDLPSSYGHVLMVLSFYLYFLLLVFVPHPWYRTCLQFDRSPLSVRAGLLSNALIPFIIALSGKSNVITWLTGVSYEKLNSLHRMMAHLCFVCVLVHTASMFVRAYIEGGSHFVHYYFWNGVMPWTGTIGLVFMALLCFFSHKKFRERFYELFLILHWPAALGLLGIMYYHTMGAYESWIYLHTSLGILFSGWIHRYFYKSSYLRLNDNWLWNDRALITPTTNGALHMTILSGITRKWRPGQHIFVRFTGLQPFANHPFSIYNLPDEKQQFTEMKLLISPQQGLTKQLAEKAHEEDDTCMRVLLDGPFGGLDRDIDSFDSIVLIASGSGISAVLPFLSHFASRKHAGISSIHFLWIIKTSSRIEWVKSELESAKNKLGSALDLRIHISAEDSETASTNSFQFSAGDAQASCEKIIESREYSPVMEAVGKASEKSSEKNCSSSSSSFDIFPIYRGRPDLSDFFSRSAKKFGPRTLMVSCGVRHLLRDVANQAAELQKLVFLGKKNENGIAYQEIYSHSEVFDW